MGYALFNLEDFGMKKRILSITIMLFYIFLSCNIVKASYVDERWQWTSAGVQQERCTYRVWHEAYDRLGISLPTNWGNAASWASNARNQGVYSVDNTPTANSIVCWGGGTEGWGHVAYVTGVDSTYVYIREGGINPENGLYYRDTKYNISNQNRWNGFWLNGYIHLSGNDSQPPTITNAKISDITKDGYTVTCNISDNVGVSRVEFPTWTPDNNGQDDLIWHQGVINGNTASYRVKISEHNNETRCTYVTHIYAWDAAGNVSNVGAVSVYMGDETPPTISNVKVSDISADGYTVTCNVSDNIDVAKVEFPTWTPDNNGQDDLIWHQGVINGNTASYRVKISEHNNETRCTYVTHIYAWDAAGNLSNIGAVSVYMGDETPPVISNIRITDISEAGYTVICDVNDNIGVTKVEFPTWTASGWLDDTIYHQGTINGNTASCRVNISEHGNARDMYYTHIYAYDATGNCSNVLAEGVLINWTTPTSMVYNGHFYSAYTFNGAYDWDSAREFCTKLGGHLVTITSAEENNAVLELMLKAGKEFAWIGASDLVEEGNWFWITGESFDYTNWADSQPDNYNGSQNYGVLWADGMWDDAFRNDSISCFIFEYDKPQMINISNTEITDVDDTGYTVSCMIDSEFPLKNVCFPTWSALNAQDDLIWGQGTINGNKVTYRVNTAEHNNRSGLYTTHVYAYDINGNGYSDTPTNKKLHTIIGNPQPSNTVEYNGHRYELYEFDGKYEWTDAKYFCEEKG